MAQRLESLETPGLEEQLCSLRRRSWLSFLRQTGGRNILCLALKLALHWFSSMFLQTNSGLGRCTEKVVREYRYEASFFLQTSYVQCLMKFSPSDMTSKRQLRYNG
ncbi:hypothetical protein CDAR_319131 [Caerostris darwini]|uniref:Uncharacterized protein n=1 Tax=Caerostris darwini TaxID=1538125 RepID=A0AAV4TYF2_9ARAC|nr:hypothetical protein CDAR_319131 [Caerostris darwini]